MLLLLVIARTGCAVRQKSCTTSEQCFSVAAARQRSRWRRSQDTEKPSRTHGLGCIKPLRTPENCHNLEIIASVCGLASFPGL